MLNSNCNSLSLINYQRNNPFELDEILIPNHFSILKTYLWYPYLVINLKSCNLDLIHNPAQIPTIFKFKQKNVVTVHDIITLIYPEKHPFKRQLLYKFLLPRTLKNADKIITVSEHTKNDLIKYFHISGEKIKVIHNGVSQKFKPLNDTQISEVKNKYNLDFPFILYVGTLEPRKNIPALIQAFKLLDKQNLPHKLVIAGKKGWKYREIFEMIEELNLSEDVVFTGYVPDNDLPALYNASDLFVYPSIYEGFGLPPLEAMACGTPVITSDTSSLPEVVGNAGITIDPKDVNLLSTMMYEVLTNDSLKQEMINKGLNRAKLFSWELCAVETLKLYEELCSNN